MNRPPFWRNPFVADPDTQKDQRRRRSYGSENRRGYFESRAEAMRTLYRDGGTLEEIGAVYGVTRERARQVIAGAAKRGTGIDPIKTVNACRKASSLTYAARELGQPSEAVRAFLKQAGYWPAMSRLWNWRRKQNYQWFTDDQLIEKLRAFAAKVGHTPGMKEVNADPDMPSHTTYVHRWGNWVPACAAAGLEPTRPGGGFDKKAECGRGHPKTPENTYTYPSTGKSFCRACNKERRGEKRQALIDAGKLKPRKHRRTHLTNPEVVAARNSFAA